MSENNFEFNLKTKLKFGADEAMNLGKYLKELGFQKIGVIIDSGVLNLDYVKKILEGVKEQRFEKVKIWEYNLGVEPDYDSLDRVKLEFLDENQKPIVDCFAGIGGGSVMDFAKGLATLAVNPGEARQYRGFPANIIPSLPTITLPTTAGTGSEVTFNAAFIDWKEKKKLGINTIYNFPVLTILDPNLVSGCPGPVAISSGLDCLVHVLEGFASRGSNYLTRVFAKEGFRLIFNNLLKALDNPKDLEAWGNLQLGSYFGGLTLLGSGGGPTGALSYILGVNFKVSHGLAGAVFLPHIVEYNIKGGYDYGELYDGNNTLSEKILELYKKLDIPFNLREFGVSEENINVLLKEAESLEKAFSQNPIPFTVEDGKKLLLNLISEN